MAINKYLNEVWQELSKVTWPSRKQTVQMTGLVLTVSAAIGFYVGGLDFIFAQLLALVSRAS
ncbi:MAG: preprotein translocase subunit SecE [Patescibacteria group bacterium]